MKVEPRCAQRVNQTATSRLAFCEALLRRRFQQKMSVEKVLTLFQHLV